VTQIYPEAQKAIKYLKSVVKKKLQADEDPDLNDYEK